MNANICWIIYETILKYNKKENKDIKDLYAFVRKLYDIVGIEITFMQVIINILENAINSEIYNTSNNKKLKHEIQKLKHEIQKLKHEIQKHNHKILNLNDIIQTLYSKIKDLQELRCTGPLVKCKATIRKIRV